MVLEKVLGGSGEGLREILEVVSGRFWRKIFGGSGVHFGEVLEKVFGRFWRKFWEIPKKDWEGSGERCERLWARLPRSWR